MGHVVVTIEAMGDEWVRLRVEDDGQGMPEEVRALGLDPAPTLAAGKRMVDHALAHGWDDAAGGAIAIHHMNVNILQKGITTIRDIAGDPLDNDPSLFVDEDAHGGSLSNLVSRCSGV